MVSLLLAMGPWANHLSLPCGPGATLFGLAPLSTASSICLLPLSSSNLCPSLMQMLITDHFSPLVKPPKACWWRGEGGAKGEGRRGRGRKGQRENMHAKSWPWLPDYLSRFVSCFTPATMAFFSQLCGLGQASPFSPSAP